MAFRDDRDALRAKNEVLESELEDRDSELARVQEALAKHEAKDEVDEEQLATLRAEVARLKRRLGEDPGPDAPAAKRRWLGAAIMLALVALVGAGIVNALVVHRADTERRRAELEAEARAAAMEVEAAHDEARRAEAEAARAAMLEEEARRAAEAARDAAEAARRNAEARRVAEGETLAGADDPAPLTFPTAQPEVYLAIVTNVRGAAPEGVRVGVGCALVKPPAGAVELHCGGLRIMGDDQTRFSHHPTERALQVSRRRRPRYTLRLATEAAPLHPRARLHRVQLSVTRTAGRPPLPLTDRSCELTVLHRGSCRAQLRCDDDLLYGAGDGGYARCQFDQERRLHGFEDDRPTPDDGDPMLSWLVDDVRVADVGWAAQLRARPLPEPASWTGGALVEGAPSFRARIDNPRSSTRDAEAGENVRVDIHHGAVVIRRGDELYRGHFGPGFRTLGGFDAAGVPFVLYPAPLPSGARIGGPHGRPW